MQIITLQHEALLICMTFDCWFFPPDFSLLLQLSKSKRRRVGQLVLLHCLLLNCLQVVYLFFLSCEKLHSRKLFEWRPHPLATARASAKQEQSQARLWRKFRKSPKNKANNHIEKLITKRQQLSSSYRSNNNCNTTSIKRTQQCTIIFTTIKHFNWHLRAALRVARCGALSLIFTLATNLLLLLVVADCKVALLHCLCIWRKTFLERDAPKS